MDDRQMGHVNQVGHLSKTHLNLLEIHEIVSIDTFESKQQNYDQIWHPWPLYEKLLGLSHLSWLSHSPVGNCTDNWVGAYILLIMLVTIQCNVAFSDKFKDHGHPRFMTMITYTSTSQLGW